jgi:hypothetical protein
LLSAEVLQNIFAIEGDNLPAGVVALLGVSDVVRLGLSFDYINTNPGCPWERAWPRRGMSRICPDFADACVACWKSLFRKRPTHPRTPLLPAPVTDVTSDRASLLAAIQRDGFLPLAAPRREGNPRAAAPRRDAVPRPRDPPGYLEELKARNYLERQDRLSRLAELEGVKVRSRLEQQARTADRIGRLFLQSPPVKKRAPTASSAGDCVKQERQASNSVEPRASLAPCRGEGAKYYGIRIGRQVGVVDTWEECKSLVDGVSSAEFRSFPTSQEANEYVRSAQRVRKVNYMNLLRPSSFIAGRAMRATVQVLLKKQ